MQVSRKIAGRLHKSCKPLAKLQDVVLKISKAVTSPFFVCGHGLFALVFIFAKIQLLF
jgi:hypothetical protein